jgi:hypothetical protein
MMPYLSLPNRKGSSRFELHACHFQWLVKASDEEVIQFTNLPNTNVLHWLNTLRASWKRQSSEPIRYQDHSNYSLEGWFGPGAAIRFANALPSAFVFQRYNHLDDDASFLEMIHYGASNIVAFDPHKIADIRHASLAATALRELVNAEPCSQDYKFTAQQQTLVLKTIGAMKPYDLNSDLDGPPADALMHWISNVAPFYAKALDVYLHIYQNLSPCSTTIVPWDGIQTMFNDVTQTTRPHHELPFDL